MYKRDTRHILESLTADIAVGYYRHFTRTSFFDNVFHGLAPAMGFHMSSADSRICLVNFSDGYIGLYDCHDIFTNDEIDNITGLTPLLYFRAHFPRKHTPFASIQLQICPWQTLPGSNVYLLEFFTVGNDHHLVHWGFRRKANFIPHTASSLLQSTDRISSPPQMKGDFDKQSFDIDMLGVSSNKICI